MPPSSSMMRGMRPGIPASEYDELLDAGHRKYPVHNDILGSFPVGRPLEEHGLAFDHCLMVRLGIPDEAGG